MSHVDLVERLLSELAAARAAITASYERRWPAAERALHAPQVDERDQPDARRDGRRAPRRATTVPRPGSSEMPLTPDAARRVYDRIGRVQDTQGFYEDAATSRLGELAGLDSARAVFELGCGTGRYAVSLLGDQLAADARYLGVDVSPTMVRLAGERLRRWAPRAQVRLLEPPALELPGEPGGFDRFVATYVFDLLEAGYAAQLLAEAHRLLAADGALCLVGLTHGETPGARASTAWSWIARRRPALLGGCRPIRRRDLVAGERWRVEHRETLTRWRITSEILVASPLAEPGDDR